MTSTHSDGIEPATPPTATSMRHSQTSIEKVQELQLEDNKGMNELQNAKTDWAQIRQDANQAEEHEHSLTIWQSCKLYRKAVFWGFVASCSIIMEGFDGSVTGVFNSLPQYQQYFGQYYPGIGWQIPPRWQVAFSIAPQAGTWFGIYFGAWLIDRSGYRKCLLFHYAVFMPLVAIQVFAKNRSMLLAGGVLVGWPFGIFATIASAYCSEVVPLKLRPFAVGWINFCWVIGIFIGNGIANAIIEIPGAWAFRGGYCLQWLTPIPLFILMYIAPESPWWLVRHHKLEEAAVAVRRLGPAHRRDQAHEIVASMVRTNQLETDIANDHERTSGSWKDLFRGTNLRRTEITVMALASQLLCGDPFASSPTYFFEQAGMTPKTAFKFGFGNSAVTLFANVVAYAVMARFGLRHLYLVGLGLLAAILTIVGGLSIVGDQGNASAKWGIAGVIYVYGLTRSICLGPPCYAIWCTASSTRLRNKSISFARWISSILGIVANVLMPYMLNPAAWNWQGKTGFFWAPLCALCFVWTFFRLPELKDRSYYELDVLFERKVPARQFKATVVEVDADEHLREDQGIDTVIT